MTSFFMMNRMILFVNRLQRPFGSDFCNRLSTSTNSNHVQTSNISSPTSSGTKVDLSLVKRKLIDILEEKGPISRRKLYDDHMSTLFPVEAFTPNQPPRPLWLRTTPEPPPVYLTMSKFKKEVLGSLAREKLIGIVTVFKVKKALEVLDLQGGLRKKIEDAISNEPVDGHVCVTGKWWREFMGKVAMDSMAQAQTRSLRKPIKKSSSKRKHQQQRR
ncbi:hypothetical protein DFH28DRAFT_363061 [Melampsora americana]|nr:hypothetical protein DFH28DRAFT_363061 [Melampsora americana]